VRRRGNGHGHDEELDPGSSPAATADEAAPAASGLEPRASDPEPAGDASQDDPLATLRRERDELREALLRKRAEFENYRKRVERDRAQAALDAETALLRQMLGTLDNLERALAAEETGTALREGVVLTHRELLAMLETLGAVPIDALGQPFDPNAHQAILHEPTPGFAPGTVSEVYRKGFRYRDRLLRPALVKVASGPDGPDDERDVDADVQ
jgi:molecular chaperone GrpE